MKKIQIIVLGLVAVFAFSAFAASSAFAADEWLAGGIPFVGELSAETTGLLFLDVLVLGLLVVQLHCEGTFDGTVTGGANGTDLVTEVLNTAKEATGTPLMGLALSCTVLTSAAESCGPVNGLAEVWPENLPWLTTIELDGGTVFLDDFPTTAGYEVLCPPDLNLVRKTNLCEGLAAAVLTNEATDVLAKFNEGENEALCTEGVGHIGGEGLTTLTGGVTLQVS